MNRKQAQTIAQTLRALIGAHMKLIGTYAPHDVYARAESESYQAKNQARYLAAHYFTRTDERAAFLRACGLDALARDAQAGLPVLL